MRMIPTSTPRITRQARKLALIDGLWVGFLVAALFLVLEWLGVEAPWGIYLLAALVPVVHGVLEYIYNVELLEFNHNMRMSPPRRQFTKGL